MRIVYISTYPPDFCGIAAYMHGFIEVSGSKDEYIVLSNPLINEKITDGITFRVLDPTNPFNSIKNALSIIKNFNPNIIHIQYVSTFFKPFMPILVNLIPYPIIMESHEVLIDRTYRKGNLRKELLKFYEKTIYRKASRIIVHNTLMERRLHEFYRINSNRIYVIPLGVDTNVDYKKSYKLHEKLLFYGYMHEDKGIDTLLQAFEIIQDRLADCELILLGGSRSEKTLKFIKDKKKKKALKIIIVGFQKDIARYMNEADVVIFPHKDVSHSLAVAEAMAYGVPIVASKVGGFRAQIREGENGLLFKANSSTDLARVVLELLSNDIAREKIGKNARQYAERELSWECVYNKIRNLYGEVS